MDDRRHSISPHDLYAQLGSGAAPILVDVRQDADFARADTQTDGTPYDIDGAEFTHEGERCSFDTILRIYDIKDAALDHLVAIVREADASRHYPSSQCGGLFAISLGLSANFPDDREMLKHALYTWCRNLQAETHSWPARAVGT
jgi:hypothetical protein